MNITPDQFIGHAIAIYDKGSFVNGRITHHIELGISQGICRNLGNALFVYTQETNRIISIKIQIHGAVHTGTFIHIATGATSKQEHNFQRNRIRVSHMRQKGIVLATISAKNRTTKSQTIRIQQQQAIARSKDIYEGDIRQGIFRHHKGDHLIL